MDRVKKGYSSLGIKQVLQLPEKTTHRLKYEVKALRQRRHNLTNEIKQEPQRERNPRLVAEQSELRALSRLINDLENLLGRHRLHTKKNRRRPRHTV